MVSALRYFSYWHCTNVLMFQVNWQNRGWVLCYCRVIAWYLLASKQAIVSTQKVSVIFISLCVLQKSIIHIHILEHQYLFSICLSQNYVQQHNHLLHWINYPFTFPSCAFNNCGLSYKQNPIKIPLLHCLEYIVVK